MGIFSSPPPTVNARGDVLSSTDFAKLEGDTVTGIPKVFIDPGNIGLKLTPEQRGNMLYNWLTAGGAPKPVEPGVLFKQKQDTAGVEAKASAGQGINSLFGVGKMIGDLAPPPVTPPVDVVGSAIKPIKMIEPMNQSPMQPGVPYSALPVGGR